MEAPGSTYSARIPIKGKADKVEAPAGAGEKTPPWDITKLGGLLGELFAASAVGAAKQSGEHGEEQRRPSFNLDGVVNNTSQGTEQSESNANTPAGWDQRKTSAAEDEKRSRAFAVGSSSDDPQTAGKLRSNSRSEYLRQDAAGSADLDDARRGIGSRADLRKNMGRGLHATRPAWQTARENKSDGNLLGKSIGDEDRDKAFSMGESRRPGNLGRGMHFNRPAWQTTRENKSEGSLGTSVEDEGREKEFSKNIPPPGWHRRDYSSYRHDCDVGARRQFRSEDYSHAESRGCEHMFRSASSSSGPLTHSTKGRYPDSAPRASLVGSRSSSPYASTGRQPSSERHPESSRRRSQSKSRSSSPFAQPPVIREESKGN